ncbi:Uncharacterised protein [Metamycoplasma cloacale]|uniref:Multidrug transporter n=1 Tax=Metamycoplasma cloacale TaxID=92401 RepID=A0A2Z4LLQ1_9BACT|nr:MATE family Na+-driven efflux transporter [Metamycoplasma cloacale]AWX42663.1 multidrug transporter [Metamycoplasma cloacale]VEU79529.1 Uncharacterised protein [Metamycoplasma cloacale]
MNNKKKVTFLKGINWKLLISMIFFMFLPTIYITVRIYWIGQLPETYNLSIAAQAQWLQVIFEILQEAIILPLFFFIGAVSKEKENLENRIRTGLIFTIITFGLLSIGVSIFVEPIIRSMGQNKDLIAQSVSFIRLEVFANLFMIIFKYLFIVLITLNKTKKIYWTLAIQLFLSIVLDIFLVSNLKVSLQLGTTGIGIVNLVTNIILMIFAFIFCKLEGLTIFKKAKFDFKWFKLAIKVCFISGLETLVRNLFFMFMILRMVNKIQESGTFWVANNFIWGWLLLPVLALGEVIKSDISIEQHSGVQKRTKDYMIITTFFIVIWIISISVWKPFLNKVMQLNNYLEIYKIVLISMPFYVLFAYNNVIDSIFYGLGRTDLMLYQSLIINGIYYTILFVLYKTNIWNPTLISIALIFAGGIALDSILTYIIFIFYVKRQKIKICNKKVNENSSLVTEKK